VSGVGKVGFGLVKPGMNRQVIFGLTTVFFDARECMMVWVRHKFLQMLGLSPYLSQFDTPTLAA
jgi:hypothetical protein